MLVKFGNDNYIHLFSWKSINIWKIVSPFINLGSMYTLNELIIQILGLHFQINKFKYN